jgi:hypothetical protein
MPWRWKGGSGCHTDYCSNHALSALGAGNARVQCPRLPYLAHIAVVEGYSAIALLGVVIQVPRLAHQLVQECALLVHCQFPA